MIRKSSVVNGFTESLDAEIRHYTSHETGLGAVSTGGSRYRTEVLLYFIRHIR